MTEALGVSIVVVNYNNADFLAAAIDSGLAQDHPICEVIVVDDCSTDGSRTVIARYWDRIRPVLRETNGHQIAALNTAWPLALYPILMFLDADDLLLPHAGSRVVAAWAPGTVKAQFPLVSVDKAGRPIGHVAPKYPAKVDTALIREALLRSGQSPSSPLGNTTAAACGPSDRSVSVAGSSAQSQARLYQLRLGFSARNTLTLSSLARASSLAGTCRMRCRRSAPLRAARKNKQPGCPH
jgi:hypothetical protein